MKIILTTHVIERRKTGNITKNKLKDVAKYLITYHKENMNKNGIYKFFKGGTTAIINKKDNKYVFITFYGRTGWVIETTDYGDFNCIYQSEEYLAERQKKQEERERRLKTKNRGRFKKYFYIHKRKIKKDI